MGVHHDLSPSGLARREIAARHSYCGARDLDCPWDRLEMF
jgi:hypothetical protein